MQSEMVLNIKRIGSRNATNVRPIIVTFGSYQNKMTVLTNAKKLRTLSDKVSYKSIFIKHDLTRMQQDEKKKLYEEIKRRRNTGENFYIKNGKIFSSNNPKSV